MTQVRLVQIESPLGPFKCTPPGTGLASCNPLQETLGCGGKHSTKTREKYFHEMPEFVPRCNFSCHGQQTQKILV